MYSWVKGFFSGEAPKQGPKKAVKRALNRAQKASKPARYVLPTGPVPGSVDVVEIDYSLFPKVRLDAKPKHTLYEQVRNDYMFQAFGAVAPYYRFLCNLKGIKDSPEMQRTIRDIIYRHIAHFWNIPSSKNHHHNVPFGGLVHSLDTACREAQLWQSGRIFTEDGVDSEMTRKAPIWQGFAGFLVGMFHDVAKIHDMEIISLGEKPIVFRTLEGELLDFHLVHPEGVKIHWLERRLNLKPCWNMLYVWTFVPEATFRQMPHDLMMRAMSKLLSYEQLRSDAESVRNWSEGKEFHWMLTQAVGQWFLQRPEEFRQTSKSMFHKLDANWLACDLHGFVGELARRLGHQRKDLLLALRQAEQVAVSKKTNRYYAKVVLKVGEERIERDTCFFRTDVFTKAFEKIAKGEEPFRLANNTAVIDLASRPAVEEIFSDVLPALSKYAYDMAKTKKDEPPAPASTATARAASSKKKAAPASGGGSREEKAVVREKKEEQAEDVPSEEIDIESFIPDIPELKPKSPIEQEVQKINLLEEESQEGEGNAAEVHGVTTGTEPVPETAQPLITAQDEGAGQGESALDKHLAAAVEQAQGLTTEGVPFYKLVGDKISPEEAQVRFARLLTQVGKKAKTIQRQRGAFMWLSTDGKLYMQYPSGPNRALDIPASRLSDETKILRSKFNKHLVDLGYSVDWDGGEPSANSQLRCYLATDDQIEVFSVYSKVIELNPEKIMDLSPDFTARLKKLFSINASVQAQGGIDGVEA